MSDPNLPEHCPSFVTPAQAGARERPSAARAHSSTLDPRVRGDDEGRVDDRSPSASPPRYHRWTSARQVEFLHALLKSGSVTRAARSVGMSRQSAYRLRDRLPDSPFAEAWDLAIADRELRRAMARWPGPPGDGG